MAKEKLLVYECPFCSCFLWFNRQHELSYHFYKEHMQDALMELASQYKISVSKTEGKWNRV